jgi:hypothetical protein
MIKPTFPALKETCTVGSTIFDEHHDFQARCFRKHPARWETLSLSRGWYIYIIHSNPRKGRTGICHNLLIIYNSGIFNYRVNMPYITLVYPILVFFPLFYPFQIKCRSRAMVLGSYSSLKRQPGELRPAGTWGWLGVYGFFSPSEMFLFLFFRYWKDEIYGIFWDNWKHL